MYQGPSNNGDNFTDVLRYNLSDPALTSSSIYGEGITMTGYGDRSNFTTPPFAAEDIIILSDGLCGSTCALFVEFMTTQAGVKVIVLGGRPQNGPMQPVGGTKGSLMLDADYLNTYAEYLITEFASTTAERRAWTSVLPEPFPIRAFDASINFLDSIRSGDETATPTQFTNETANCRLWYTPEMAMDVMKMWAAVAGVAWGGPEGGIDDAKCVPGSYRKESLLEDPPVSQAASGGSSTSSSGSSTGPDGKANAAVPLDARWVAAVLLAFVVSVTLL